MSRHRNVRNLQYEDYEDPDFYDDQSYYSTSPDIPTEYLPPPPNPNTDFFSSSIAQAEEDHILKLATEEVRRILGENYSKQSVDNALRNTHYDPNAAIEFLLENPSQTTTNKSNQNNVSGAQATDIASGFGALLSEETGPSRPTNASTQVPSLSLIQDKKQNFDVPKAKPEEKPWPKAQRKVPPPDPPTKKMANVSLENEQKTKTAKDESDAKVAKPKTDAVEERQKSSVIVKQRAHPLDPGLLEREFLHSSIVVVGHVDAGKSTLVGQIVSSLSENSGRRGMKIPGGNLAWLLDEDEVERDRGVTINISVRQITVPASKKLISIIDSPGHRDFVPMMIVGASMASAAVLVVDSTSGEFEAGFSEEGQTREHAVLLRSVGITHLVVACNKMDSMEFSESRFLSIKETLSTFLKQSGFKTGNVVFVPCSGTQGINVVDRVKDNQALASWYSGPSIVEAMDALAKPVMEGQDRPTRFSVTEVIRSQELGTGVSGQVLSGTIALEDKLLMLPQKILCGVKKLRVMGEEGNAVAMAGDSNVSVSLSNIAVGEMSLGSVLCSPEKPCPVATGFKAQIVVVGGGRPITQGYRAVVHVNGASEACTVVKLIEILGSSNNDGGSKRPRPRLLTKGHRALVEVRLQRGVCMETFSEVRSMGRIMLRNNGRTVAVGIVLEVGEAE